MDAEEVGQHASTFIEKFINMLHLNCMIANEEVEIVESNNSYIFVNKKQMMFTSINACDNEEGVDI